MSCKKCFAFLVLTCALLFFGAREAHACSCIRGQSVLNAYENAEFIVLTRAVSVEKSEKAAPEGRMSDGENYVDGVMSTRMLVERVFKGSLKAGDEITFAQGGGGDCIWTFSEKQIGEQFLFYLSSREKNPATWYASICGRSKSLKQAGDDLLYLNKLDRVRGKSRLSGTLRFEDGDDPGVEGTRIRITGAGKTYELKTDKEGVYEIYDLPAGEYQVEVEVPPGWKLAASYHRSETARSVKRGEAPKGETVTVADKKHTALDIYFEIDNAVRGKVYDPDGRALKDVWLDLVHAQGETPKYFYKTGRTNEAGMFEITEIPPGSYLLVINKDGKISGSEPFGTLYHPGVSERERATIITIGAGESLEDMDTRVPRVEETITVEGLFLYSDGKPVVNETVVFKAAKSKENVEGDNSTTTDARGRFSLRILKGMEGELYGEMYTYLGEFENCPKLEAFIKKSGGSSMNARSSVMKIRAAEDLPGAELKYSFPGCTKAKESQ